MHAAELGQRRQQRYERRLIDVAERRMAAANDEIQFVPKDVVLSGNREMHDGHGGGNHSGSQECTSSHSLPIAAVTP